MGSEFNPPDDCFHSTPYFVAIFPACQGINGRMDPALALQPGSLETDMIRHRRFRIVLALFVHGCPSEISATPEISRRGEFQKSNEEEIPVWTVNQTPSF